MFLLAPFCLTGSYSASRAEWGFRLKSCGQRACWQEVKWITFCMYKYVNSASVYYPWRGCITHSGPAPNCISWLLCSHCWCHTMKQVWMLVFRVIPPPPTQMRGFFIYGELFRCISLGSQEGGLYDETFGGKQNEGSLRFPAEIWYWEIHMAAILCPTTECIQWHCGHFWQSDDYLHFNPLGLGQRPVWL